MVNHHFHSLSLNLTVQAFTTVYQYQQKSLNDLHSTPLHNMKGGENMEFELSIETLEDVSPKHPLMGCSSKPLNLCKLF